MISDIDRRFVRRDAACFVLEIYNVRVSSNAGIEILSGLCIGHFSFFAESFAHAIIEYNFTNYYIYIRRRVRFSPECCGLNPRVLSLSLVGLTSWKYLRVLNIATDWIYSNRDQGVNRNFMSQTLPRIYNDHYGYFIYIYYSTWNSTRELSIHIFTFGTRKLNKKKQT